MGKKRKNATATSEASYYNKRQRASYPEGDEDETSSPSTIQPRVDPTYGQRGAFPGLDDDGDELFYGPASDGLEYLKMVRSEARGVPNLLVAPKPAPTEQDSAANYEYEPALDSSRGYYADGAYTAAPTLGPSLPAPNPTTAQPAELDPQDAYYARLRLRFSLLRATLRCTPPAERIAALDDDHPISLPAGSKRAFVTWRRLLASADPTPAQLASLDHGSVLRLLGIVTKELKRGRAVRRRGGAWVWGLLGRCREVGECGSEEVGVLRELGKRAVWVLRGWREGREGRGHGVSGDAGGSDGDGVGDEEEGGSQIVEDEDGDGRDADGGEEPAESRSSVLPRNPDVDTHAETPIPDTSDACLAPPVDADLPGRLDAEIQVSEQSVRNFESTNVRPPTGAKANASASDIDHHESENAELAIAKERLKARLAESVDTVREVNDDTSETEDVTFATLDMILTVVGEFYGQRDLLEFRDLWDEMA